MDLNGRGGKKVMVAKSEGTGGVGTWVLKGMVLRGEQGQKPSQGNVSKSWPSG